MANVELNIGGMTCGGCVRSVQRKLAGLPGVSAAAVDLGSAKATVEFAETVTGIPAMVGAVEAIGFQASA
jgi:copper chaperone